jgi:hypothetical protein
MFGQYLFYSTMDGELSSTTPGSNMYGARFEKGSYLKYLYSTSSNSWIVTDKSGSVYADPEAVTAVATTTITTGGGGAISTSTIALTSTTTNITLGFNSTTTKTWTITSSGSNPLIVLTASIWQDVAGSGTIGSASWNGAVFTKATSTRTVGIETEIWYLVASTTGNKTISVTINGNTDAIKLDPGYAHFCDPPTFRA